MPFTYKYRINGVHPNTHTIPLVHPKLMIIPYYHLIADISMCLIMSKYIHRLEQKKFCSKQYSNITPLIHLAGISENVTRF